MLKKIIFFLSILSWSTILSAYSLKNIKLQLAGYGGFSTPSMMYSDKKNQDITRNRLVGGVFSIQFLKNTSIDIGGSHFWPYSSTQKNIMNAENQYAHTTTIQYTTNLFDIALKRTLYHLTPHTKFYLKGGVWGLRINQQLNHQYISQEANDIKENNKAVPQMSSLIYWGYGVLVGPGINWSFSPRSYSSLSLDLSALVCIPIPIPFLGENHAANLFPLIRGGVNWHAK